ncbi:MAG: helix-hairpin-helix domain-containing protein [Thermoproteota archaeon]
MPLKGSPSCSTYSRNMVQGLFLSSGIGRDPDVTMEGMIQAVEVLRGRYGFHGYIHRKILPGSSRYNVERAVQLADRVSLNVEASSETRLREVATVKNYGTDILRRQAWVRELSSSLPSGQTTQFIVGAADETDLEIIRRMCWLYEEMDMRRVYYSAFEPIPRTELQSRPATPSWREHRLYQVDNLYRVYRYSITEIEEALIDGFLPNVDPKITLARRFFEGPVDVNEASLYELLRVPGIGPVSARRIISLRRRGVKIRSRKQLAEAGVVLMRAQPFLKLFGSYQSVLEKWL